MKCLNCNSCLTIVMVENRVYWFCDLCFNTYTFMYGKRNLIEDKEIINKAKLAYKEKIKRTYHV